MTEDDCQSLVAKQHVDGHFRQCERYLFFLAGIFGFAMQDISNFFLTGLSAFMVASGHHNWHLFVLALFLLLVSPSKSGNQIDEFNKLNLCCVECFVSFQFFVCPT